MRLTAGIDCVLSQRDILGKPPNQRHHLALKMPNRVLGTGTIEVVDFPELDSLQPDREHAKQHRTVFRLLDSNDVMGRFKVSVGHGEWEPFVGVDWDAVPAEPGDGMR